MLKREGDRLRDRRRRPSRLLLLVLLVRSCWVLLLLVGVGISGRGGNAPHHLLLVAVAAVEHRLRHSGVPAAAGRGRDPLAAKRHPELRRRKLVVELLLPILLLTILLLPVLLLLLLRELRELQVQPALHHLRRRHDLHEGLRALKRHGSGLRCGSELRGRRRQKRCSRCVG